MVEIRIAKETDKTNIVEFAQANGLDVPYSEFVLVAIEGEDIVGVIGLDKMFVIEPLVANSSVVAQKLYDTMMGAAFALGSTKVECLVNDKNVNMKSILKKLGFNFVESINRYCKILMNSNG